MAGIIASMLDDQQPESPPPILQRQVGQQELTSTQLESVLDRGSPYLTRARAEGEQYAARRGLINSSIAGQAATGAAIDRALPIAQSNAQTYGRAASEQFDVNARDAMMHRENALRRGDMRLAHDLDRSMAAYQNALRQGDMRLAAEIERDMAAFQNVLRQGDMQLAHTLDRAMADHQNALRRGDMQLAAEIERNMAAFQNALRQGDMRLASELDQNLARLNNELQRGTIELQNRLGREATAEEIRLQTESRARLMELENAHRQTLQNSQIAQSVWQSAQTAISSILADPNIPAANKDVLVQRIQENARMTLTAIGVASGINFGDLFPAQTGIPTRQDIAQAVPAAAQPVNPPPSLTPVNPPPYFPSDA